VSLFAGTSGAATAFVPDSTSLTGYSYQGNGGVNTAAVGDNLQLDINVPGDQVFTNANGNVLGSLSQLISALGTGTTGDIGAAVTAVRSALSNVSQQRVLYAGVVNQINAQEGYLSQETVSLTSQQQSLTGVDITEAISNLTQAQIAHSTLLAATAKVLPTSLLDYLK
jgi:flagellar hook-associated protein 3 FlgL